MDMHALRFRLVDGANSWGARHRERRASWLAQTFPDLAQMSVVDLGGRLGNWLRAPVRPKRLHLINLEPMSGPVPDWVEVDHGDACELPTHLALRRYDLVFSNSVLEHVGGHERRLRFAETVHGLADAHWIQTPYRYFPVEPHWIIPGMQFLPLPLRIVLARHWPLGHTRAADRQRATHDVLWTELVGRSELRHYFPRSAIRVEWLAGLPKSLIAVRGAVR
ncbi:class I SAM-dependent methyltransferase [Plantactinospora sp. GCM10030261]|uniref:class I SAM-dependent methyltransferase n=1 Tax=Plantactinospora sp. GCM10030261 TaxID=3273420 RepID=UPI00361892B4